VSVVTRTNASHDRVFQQLQEVHSNPKSANDERVKRFCQPRTYSIASELPIITGQFFESRAKNFIREVFFSFS
jgi:hypothetical protein